MILSDLPGGEDSNAYQQDERGFHLEGRCKTIEICIFLSDKRSREFSFSFSIITNNEINHFQVAEHQLTPGSHTSCKALCLPTRVMTHNLGKIHTTTFGMMACAITEKFNWLSFHLIMHNSL